jgi:rubrerythrin
MKYSEKDIQNLVTTLNLEYGANRRYDFQIGRMQNPKLIGVLEGVRRNEGDHIDASLDILKENMPKEKVDGFASVLMFMRQNLEFEQIAAKTYAQFSQEASDPELKQMFKDLARSEVGHVNIFKDMIKSIEEGSFPVLFGCLTCGWELDFSTNPAEGVKIRCPKCGAIFELYIENDDFKIKYSE